MCAIHCEKRSILDYIEGVLEGIGHPPNIYIVIKTFVFSFFSEGGDGFRVRCS